MEIKIYDTAFSHNDFSTLQKSKKFSWIRTNEVKNLSFFTDNSLYLVKQSLDDKKIAWLLEPSAIFPEVYRFIKDNYDLFDNVLTYDKTLLEISNKFIFYPHGGCWINTKDQKIHIKLKIVSILLSNKQTTTGHILRHTIIKTFNNIDVFGNNNYIENKIIALKDYAFSIIIENSKNDYYFTEKLIDCFITGTIPIYWGCPSIGNFFNLNGMIIIDNLNDLEKELKNLSLEKYSKMITYVKDNYLKAKDFLISEDWIYNNTNLLNNYD